MPPQGDGGRLGLLVGGSGSISRNEDEAERQSSSSSSSFPPSPSHHGGSMDTEGATAILCYASLSSSSSPSLPSLPLPLPARRKGLSSTDLSSASLALAAPSPAPSTLALHQRSSSSIVETTTTTTTTTTTGSKRRYLLSGLARLVPMGMPSLPRTSGRYKRYLSCADLDTFREEQQQRQEEEAVLLALLQLQLNDENEGEEGREEGQQQLSVDNIPALLAASSSLTPADVSAILLSPTTTSSTSSSSSVSSPNGTRTIIRRCLSMPVAPVSAPLPFSRSRSSTSSSSNSGHGELVVNFPGGGKFFYWQSGVATFLNRHFDLANAQLVGASAGSLTATLMACHVDAHHATAVAVKMLRKHKVYERALGLVGVWGGVVRDWLQEILPENAAELCRGRVHISVLCLPYRRHHVSDFRSKEDLIETCLASAHLPLVMDGRPFCMWRGWPCVDGSILAGRKEVPSHLRDAETVTFDYVEDEMLVGGGGRGREGGKEGAGAGAGGKEFMTLEEGEGLGRLVEMGYRFAERMNEGGRLHPAIQRVRRASSVEGGMDGSSSSKSGGLAIIPPEELPAGMSPPLTPS